MHRQGVDVFGHQLGQRLVDQLLGGDPRQAPERLGHHNDREMSSAVLGAEVIGVAGAVIHDLDMDCLQSVDENVLDGPDSL